MNAFYIVVLTSVEWELLFEHKIYAVNCVNFEIVPHREHCVSNTKTKHLVFLRGEIAVYYDKQMDHTKTLCGRNCKNFITKPSDTYTSHYDLRSVRNYHYLLRNSPEEHSSQI
jgi:hypothetical protein